MTNVLEIEKAIEKLPREDYRKLRSWIEDYDLGDKQYSEDITLTGYVDAPSYEKENFYIVTEKYGRVRCPLDMELGNYIKRKNANGYPRNFLSLKVEAVFDQDETLKGVIKIMDYNFQENAEIFNKIEKFYDLEDGWAGVGSRAPIADHLEKISNHLVESYDEELPLPFIGLMPDGNLLLEWDGEHNLSAEITLETGECYLHAIDTKEIDKEKEINFLQDTEAFHNFVKEVIS